MVPDADTLHLAALRAVRIAKVQATIDAMSEADDAEAGADIPEDIEAQVRKVLKRSPALSWDAALVEIMRRRLRKREI